MPRDYDSPEEMQEVIEAYFATCDIAKRPYTVQGLVLALGWSSRQTLLNYENEEKRPEFVDTVKRAKLRVEQNKVEGAMMGDYNPTIVIFDLKNNHDHKDKSEVEQSGSMAIEWKEERTYETKP